MVTILVYTDGEADDWMALYLLHCMTKAYENLDLFVVVCYRSRGTMDKIAHDARRLMPGAAVRIHLDDSDRDGGYPDSSAPDEIPLYTTEELAEKNDIVAVVCLSLLEVVAMFMHATVELLENPLPPLFLYGGVYNLRTGYARDVRSDWKKYAHVFQFDGHETFGAHTNFSGDGAFMSMLSVTEEEVGYGATAPAHPEFAAHILKVRDTWNPYIASKFEEDIRTCTDPARVLRMERIIAQIREDPGHAVAADPFVILMMLMVTEDTELINGISWRPCVAPSETSFSKYTSEFLADVRAYIRDEFEDMLVELAEGDFPEKVPMLPMLKRRQH